MSTSTKAVIVSFGRGPKSQRPKHCLLKILSAISATEASQFIGHKVTWPLGERKCIGKIIALHGRRGLARARFERGLPGQALGSLVEIT